jgi:hypothetical protein
MTFKTSIALKNSSRHFVLCRTFSALDDSLHKIPVQAKHMIHKKTPPCTGLSDLRVEVLSLIRMWAEVLVGKQPTSKRYCPHWEPVRGQSNNIRAADPRNQTSVKYVALLLDGQQVPSVLGRFGC